MAFGRPSRERPAVGRLARFNVAATSVIAISATIVVVLAGCIAYGLVLVIAELNIDLWQERLAEATRHFGGVIMETEQRQLTQFATTGVSRFPPFVQTYRPGQAVPLIADQTRQQLDARLAIAVTPADHARINTWVQQSPSRYERWLLYHDDRGRQVAVRVDYQAPVARAWLDRRIAGLTSETGATIAWFPMVKQSTPALNRLLHTHGLSGNVDATTMVGVLRSKSDLNITVNSTKVRGDAIAIGMPMKDSNLLLVALGTREDLGGVALYTRAVIIGTSAILIIIWAAAIAWIRGTKRQAALALQQSNFVAAVSHELRTPLTAIRGAAEMLAHEMVPDEKRLGYYQSILVEADRLSRMVEQILDFDRLQRGRLDVRVQPTDLTGVIQRVAGMMQPVAAKRDVYLDVVPAASLTVQADPDTMAQALTNLIDNAIKFSPNGGEVRVALDRREGSAILSVDDTGPGVPKAERGRIFDAFYRVGDEHTRRTKGSGLGLYLVRRYVDAVGGTIRVTDADGGGARFEVELPLV